MVFSPISFFKRILKPRIVRLSILCISVALFLFLVLQIGSKYLLKHWLLKNGADSVTIDKMYLNPFTGKLILNGVDIGRADDIVYSDSIFHLNIGMTSLFKKEILVEQVIVRDMLVDIHHDESGALRIGSYRLPADKEKESGQGIFPPWTLQAKELVFRNSTIQYRQDGLVLQLVVDNADAQRLDSSTNEESGRLNLSGRLNGAPLEMEINGFLLEPFPSVTGKLKLADFQLQELERIFGGQLTTRGAVSIIGPLAVTTEGEGQITVHFDGTVELLHAAFKNETWSASGDLGWKGEIRHKKLSGEKMKIEMDGILAARSLSYRDKEMEIEAGLDSFSAEGDVQIGVDEKMTISSDVKLALAEIDLTAEKGVLSTASASWQGTVEYGDNRENMATIAGDGIFVVKDFDLALPGTVKLRQPYFETSGKSEVGIADNLHIRYDGESTFAGTELTTGRYGFSARKMTYRGKSGYENPTEGEAALKMDGSLTLEKLEADSDDEELHWIQESTEIDGDFNLALGATPLLTGNASLKIEDGALSQAEETAFSFGELAVDRLKTRIVSNNLDDLAAETVTLQSIALPATKERTFAFQMDSAQFSTISSDDLRKFTIAQLDLVGPLLTDEQKGRLAALEGITAHKIAVLAGGEVRVEEIKGRQAEFPVGRPKEDGTAPVLLAGIDVSGLSWSTERGTRIEAVVGNDLQAEYSKSRDSGEEAALEKKKTEKDQDTDRDEAIPLQIDKVTLKGANRIRYTNPTLSEPFSAEVVIASLNITDLDLADVTHRFTYELEGTVDKYSPLTIDGSAAPLAEPRSWEYLLTLQGYPLANLAPFSIDAIGVELTGGKLDLYQDLNIKGDKIELENRIEMKEIESKTVEPDRFRQFNQKLPVSLDTALSFLRGDGGTITLSIPIEGKLSSMDVNYRDIIVTALSNSIATAVRPLLAYSVLGPGGVLAYLGLELGKRIIDPELPELTYERNAVELTEAQKAILDNVGKRLAEKIKSEKDTSYYIYPKVVPGERSASLLEKQQRQDLHRLGEQRARKVREYLLKNFDLSEENLLQFQPGINYAEDAHGTVSFMK
jgi:hypothetical protein